tara:strand:- start:242 stop:541 length:300 start_codon:yes stop_codon:yes gene_type:complete
MNILRHLTLAEERLWWSSFHGGDGCRHENVEADKMRERVPRKPEGPLRAAPCHDERLARPHRDPLDENVEALGQQRLCRMIMAPHAGSSGNEEERPSAG